jgi:cytochrome c oxidase assembly protein subunit 15
MLATGVTGAIAALGDTLFPAKSFAEGLAHELSAQAHLFVRLRVLHPFVAVGTAVGVAWMSSRVARTAPPRAARAASMLGFAILTQSALGVVNLLLAAPTWMQLVHLFAADVVWLVLMVLGLELLAAPQSSAAPNPAH